MRTLTHKDFKYAKDDAERVRLLLAIVKKEAVYIDLEENDMGRNKIIDARVKETLELFPETRINDHLLYKRYIEAYHFVDFNANVFVNYQEYGLPPFATIERSGRDIRSKFPNLRGDAATQEARAKAEAEYREYAIENHIPRLD